MRHRVQLAEELISNLSLAGETMATLGPHDLSDLLALYVLEARRAHPSSGCGAAAALAPKTTSTPVRMDKLRTVVSLFARQQQLNTTLRHS